MRRLIVVCIILSIILISAVHAGNGKVIYLYSGDLAKSRADGAHAPKHGRMDLIEADLSSGKRSVLVKNLFNKPFAGLNYANMAVSHDGRYAAIPQDDNGIKLWDRKTKRVKSIYPEYTNEELYWSNSNRYLVFAPAYPEDPTKIYDTYTGRMKTYTGNVEMSCAAWSAKRDDRIFAVNAPKKGSTVYLQSFTGRRRVLLRWSDNIYRIAEFGYGSSYALCDSAGVFIYKPNGMIRRMQIYRSRNDPWDVEFMPQPNGSWMAALASYVYGEPHINNDLALYVFRSGDNRSRCIAKWQISYSSIQPNSGSVTEMSLAGWTAGTSKVVLKGQVIWGGESILDNRGDRSIFMTFDIPDGRKGKKIFDSGPGCLSAVWWPGK
ncbi:MAG: hypothetical protein ACYC27_11440 [Armatimonadota bacterium]